MKRFGVLRRLLRKPVFLLGGTILLLELFVALFGARLVKTDPFQMVSADRLKPPSAEHRLGTDEFGRDVYARLIHGTKITVRMGAISVGIALVAGGLVGLVSGYFGGWLDVLLMGFIDVMLAFPTILLALAIVAVLGPGLNNAMIAVGIASTPAFARLVRGSTLEVRQQVYVEAARAVGAPPWRIMWRHILPNILAPLIVLLTLEFPGALLSAAALGFAGLGAQPPEPEWGAMLVSARNYLRRAPWMVNAPGVAIMVTVLAFNLVGNALRDVLDPTQRNT